MSQIDPITLATIWHSFQSTCREMRHIIVRTAQGYLMAVLQDLSVGVWLADGTTVAVPVGLPPQFMGTRFAIEDLMKKFGDNLEPGDVILVNDPYGGGHNCHLPDWGFFRPIFHDGELLFWTLVRGHQMDNAGNFPGGYFPNAYDIHAEGLRIPPLKVIKAGEEQSELFELIWANVRWPHGVRIDNYSMIATTKFAEDRILEVVGRYGRDTVMGSIDEMLDRSERAVRAEIAAFPDGTYTGEAATDDDGTILDKPVWVRLDLTIKGDEMTLDFSRSDPQTPGFVNNVYAAAYASAVTTVLLHFDPALADFHNEGSMRPITMIAPEGRVVNAQYPATVGAAPVAVGTQIMESVLEALGKAVPERSMAAWGKHRGCYTFALDPRYGQRYVRTSFDYDGSCGAVWGYDGMTGPSTMPTMGQVMKANIEEAELRFPWRMLKREICTDLMGAGRWRGGGGIDWRAVNEGGAGRIATGSSDGDEMLGKGQHGGHPCPPCRAYLQREDGELVRAKPHRLVEFMETDTYIKLSSGGGGVGDPRERPVEKVVEDVRNGYSSVQAARLIYKVVLDPETLAVDEAETARLRSEDFDEYEVVINEESLEVEIQPVADRELAAAGD
ncbi:MAG: hydantoinase B/oxoprolinase family protein [Thermoleophilia bacterium]|nr:hydantoinase B/oxoprolinase family protein [Thermoleophilia bacterium]